MLHLRTLGQLAFQDDDRPDVRLRRKPLALLAWLIRHGSQPVSREMLADLLWGDTADIEHARKSLRQALSELRGALGDRLRTSGELIEVATADIEMDVVVLEGAIAAGHWSTAIECWQGEFLAGLDDLGGEPWRGWLDAERASLRRQYAVALESATMDARQRGAWETTEQWARRWHHDFPVDERACMALVEALRAQHRHAEAAAFCTGFIARLEGEYGSKPSAEIVALLESLEQSRSRGVAHTGTRALFTPDLVGRQTALAVLLDVWDHIRDQHRVGAVVVVEGDEGLGKSRLCEEFAQRIRRERVPRWIAETRSFLAERSRPYSSLRPLIAQLADAPGLAALSPEQLALLSHIAPVVGEQFRHLPPVAREGHAGSAARRAIEEVAHESPLLVVIDDAPDADVSSLDVYADLFRRPPAGVMIVMTGRCDAWAASPMAHDLARQPPHVRRIELQALHDRDVLHAISSMTALDPSDATRLAEYVLAASGGNPGLLVQQVHHLVEHGVIEPDASGRWRVARSLDAGDIPVPAALQDTVRVRLEEMNVDTREWLEAAAVIGPRFDIVLVERLLEHPATFRQSLGALLLARMLRPSAGQRTRYEFANEALQRVVYESTLPSRRQELHARVALLLRAHAQSSTDADIAWHRSLAGAKAQRHGRRVGIAVGIAAMLLVAIFAWRWRPTAPDLTRAPVVLADVENLTQDSVLGRALQVAVVVGLQSSPQVSLLPSSRLREILVRMRREDATTIDEALAREIAVRSNVDRVVVLSVSQVDTGFTLTGRIIDPHVARDLFAHREQAVSRATLVAGLDRLLQRVRQSLGEHTSTRAAERTVLPEVTTSSLEALIAYSEGTRLWTRGDFGGARRAFERAIAFDSAFALAWASLADVNWFGVRDLAAANAALDRAIQYSGRLSAREELMLRIRGARMRGPESGEIELLQELVNRYPDRDTWFSLGTTLMRLRRCEEAIPALQHSIGLDSQFVNAVINVATCQQYTGAYEAAVESYARAVRLDSLRMVSGNLNFEWGQAVARVRGLDAADSIYRAMLSRPAPLDRAYGWRSLALAAMQRGQYRRALAHLDSAIALAREANAQLPVYRNHVYAAHAALTLGDVHRARSSLRAASTLEERLSTNPIFLLEAGRAYVRAGMLREAEQARERAFRIAPEAHVQMQSDVAVFDAMLFVARRRFPEALAALDRVRDTTSMALIRAVRAEAYTGLGNHAAARAEWQALVEAHYPLSDDWMRAPQFLAKANLLLGDTTSARAAYQLLVARWKEADADLPALREAMFPSSRQAAAPQENER